MTFDPNYLSPAFQTAAAGYLSTPARALADKLDRLPEAKSLRERAILEAIADGIRNPSRWERNRAPIVLRNKPVIGADGVKAVIYV
jgi:hypothetical protein